MERPRVPKGPKAPSSAELEEHLATAHAVHRSWCGHCMRARATWDRHLEVQDPEEGDPTLSMDYFFFGEQEAEETTSLVIVDSVSKMSWATTLDGKTSAYAVSFVLSCLRETGYRRVVLKSDGEPSIKALKEEVRAKASGIEVVVRETRTGDKRSNGAAEVGVREVKRQCRALLSTLEEKLGTKLDPSHPLLTWLARHASFCLSRFAIKDDGRTPYQRLHGRKWNRPLVEFGERIWFRPLDAYRVKGSLQSRVLSGLFVGTHGRDTNILAMTSDGVIKGTTVHRMSETERWDTKLMANMKGVPWKLRPRMDETIDSSIVISLPEVKEKLTPITRDGGPRNLYVRKKDLLKPDGSYDYTPGCPGCEAIMVGMPAVAHNADCRMRVTHRLETTDEGRKRLAEVMERQERGKIAKAKADVPVVDGRPDAEDHEVRASEALGEPVRERRDSDEVTSPRAEKKAKAKPQSRKRVGENLDDLYHELEGTEAPAVSAGAAASSSAGLGMPRPDFGPELTDEQMDERGRAIFEGEDDAMEAPDQQRMTPQISENATVEQVDLHFVGLVDTEEETVDAKMFHELGESLDVHALGKHDITEIFSPPRFTKRANSFGLKPGYAIDLETSKGNGERWDLTNKTHQRDLEAILNDEDPYLLTGSPPCEAFSLLQGLNKNKVPEEVRKQRLEEGREKLRIAVRYYKERRARGRYFLHEHPAHATSWKEPEVVKLMEQDDVYVVEGPMCRWGMKSKDASGVGYVRKPTRWMTNSKVLAEILQKECPNKEGRTWHRHVMLVNGRAKAAQVYPPALVAAILKGIKAQMKEDGEIKDLGNLNVGAVPDEEPDCSEEYFEGWFPEQKDEEDRIYVDDITGVQLPTDKVLEARQEELQWIHRQKIYEKRTLDECWAVTGKAPITLKWIDRNKGDSLHPNFRSRLVVREVKKQHGALPAHMLFSNMPPLEAAKILCSLLASKRTSKSGKLLKLALYDISRAHFYGESQRSVYVTLPEGDESEGKCALLHKTMYGTQDASHVWQEHYSRKLIEKGFVQGQAWTSVFTHPERDVMLLVHGDDFLVLGDEDGQKYLKDTLSEHYDYRCDGCIGPEDNQHMTLLNRIVTYHKDGSVSFEADPRHAEMIIRQLGLEGSKGISTPGEKKKLSDVVATSGLPPMNAERTTLFRSLVMRAQFLGQDRADIAESVKSLTRKMKSPTEADFKDLKRLGRYLIGKPRVVNMFEAQRDSKVIKVFCDSDHAGCLLTRRSTTGLVLTIGRHTIKTTSNLQSTIALSSGESEFYALVRACAFGLSVQALYRDWGLEMDLVVASDSSAARGTASRRGLGKLRHVQTRYLWIQERVAKNELKIIAVGTKQNVADLCTKPVNKDTCEKHMKTLGQIFATGKASGAKALES